MYQLRLATWIYQRHDKAVFILKKLEAFLKANLLKSTASKIKKKLSVNDSLLVYSPFNNPNMPSIKQIDQLTGGSNE